MRGTSLFFAVALSGFVPAACLSADAPVPPAGAPPVAAVPDYLSLPGVASLAKLPSIPGFPGFKRLSDIPEGTLVLLIADRSRGNLEGVSWRVRIDDARKAVVFAVKARGYDFLARTQEPAKHRGDSILMVRHNMWFHKIGLSKPVPISQRQKLLGGAAYGDIPATNYATDYEIRGIEDGALDGEACRVFSLEAKKDRKTTYDKVRYWVSRSRGLGIKSEFYTVSGKLIKTAAMQYDNEVTVDGVKIPFISAIQFREELVGSAVTGMKMTEARLETVSASELDLNLFQR